MGNSINSKSSEKLVEGSSRSSSSSNPNPINNIRFTPSNSIPATEINHDFHIDSHSTTTHHHQQQQQRSRWSFSHFVNVTRNQSHKLSLSYSLQSFSLSRFLSKSSTKLSGDSLAAQTKTSWPTPSVILIFLPQFKLVTKEYLQSKYEFNGAIARGAFGVVHRVIDVQEQKKYALKVLSKAQIIRDNSVLQLKNEVDIQTICGHNSFIVKCLSFWQTHKEIYLLSELVEGGELFDRIHRFSHKLVQLYVAEIAVALDFLHNAGVIYRDLKPENILLDDNLHIKLIDFGLSKWLKIGQRTNTICGTLQYMAPEILNGEAYGHAVDWYALGVVACRMLTDKYPTLNIRPRIPINNTGPPSCLPRDEIDNIGLINIPSIKSRTDSPGTTTESTKKLIWLPEEANELPLDCKDLLLRLLEFEPETRIRSIFGLQRIAMYKGFNFEDVRKRKIDPKEFFLTGDGIVV